VKCVAAMAGDGGRSGTGRGTGVEAGAGFRCYGSGESGAGECGCLWFRVYTVFSSDASRGVLVR
ncbi:MAG: hypothetical protein WD737_07205, partial [Gemmatimonadota bacterium]